MSLLSIITTCKGRLDHLKQTLPSRMGLADCEVIVVDYDCPQGTGAWVQEAYSAAKVVRVADRPYFNRARARNLGAAAASSPWLVFIDADVGVVGDLIEAVRPRLAPGHFLFPEPRPLEAWGTVIVAREDFARIEGYDEIFEGWGAEDDDLTWRLARLGRRANMFPGTHVLPLHHEETIRTEHHEIRDRDLSQAVNALYMAAKHDLIRQGIAVDLALRKMLYRDFQRLVLGRGSRDERSKTAVGFRRTDVGLWSIHASLHYELAPADTGRQTEPAVTRPIDES